MPISIILQQQVQEEAADDVAKDPPRGEDPVPERVAEDPLRGEDPVPEMEVKVERSPVPDSSPPSPPPTAPAPADTADPSYTAQQSSKHIHVSFRELVAVMDAVCTLATT